MSASKKYIGYLFGALAAALYGTNPLFALPLYADGMDAWSVLFFRYALSLPLLALMMLCTHVSFRLNGKELLQLVLLGILMAGSSAFLYESYIYMDAGIASTILFIYPILTAVLMAFVFHERLHGLVWGCLLLAAAGIVVLYDGGVAKVSLLGTILVIFSALTYAIYLVFINKGHITTMPPMKVTFYVLLFGSLMLVAGLLWQGRVVMPEGWHWCYSLGSAIFPTAISLVLTTLAIQYIGSTETAILGAFEPITAVLIGISVFGEQLSWRNILGIVMIVVAVTLVVSKDKLLNTTRHPVISTKR